MVAELRRVANIISNQPVTIEIFNQHGQMNAETIRRRFGSWTKALKHSGLKISNLGRRYTEEEYRENLLTVWTYYGRQPTYGEMSNLPSTIRARAYETKGGKWTSALNAFVQYANSAPETLKNEQPASTEALDDNARRDRFSKSNLTEKITRERKLTEDKRKIPLPLRFSILTRDKFKCVLCGDNPSKNPLCILNVDHILPWSKGGKTRADNLRTLCEPCNLGRSNLYLE